MNELIDRLQQGDRRALARCISLVENEASGYEALLQQLPYNRQVPVTGITGPPGAGKSTLISAIAKYFTEQGKKLAVIAIDPSSPFNHGALMGDRLRMNEHFLHPGVFIRSMASRGSLGGLAPRVFEVVDIMKAAGFDHIIIETVGVGQSEVEIAALADTTVLALVPEAGDEIQTIKSGVMEIADVYVLNKSDRDGADMFFKNLIVLAHHNIRNGWEAPVVKTVASANEGIAALAEAIDRHWHSARSADKKVRLLAEKAMMLIRDQRTKDIRLPALEAELAAHMQDENFNLYRYVKQYNA